MNGLLIGLIDKFFNSVVFSSKEFKNLLWDHYLYTIQQGGISKDFEFNFV